MSTPLPVEDAVSAGGIVWRRSPSGEIEVVLCGRSAEHARKTGHSLKVNYLWVLPKGTPDPGEQIEQTALREVQEETGLLVHMGESLGRIEYWFVAGGRRIHKRVYHWLMEPAGGDLANHDHEFDDVTWVPIDRAIQVLSYENERQVLQTAAQKLAALA